MEDREEIVVHDDPTEALYAQAEELHHGTQGEGVEAGVRADKPRGKYKGMTKGWRMLGNNCKSLKLLAEVTAQGNGDPKCPIFRRY